MAIVGSQLLDHFETEGGIGLLGRRGAAGQVVLRASSGRAYAFEVHPQEAVSDLAEIGAVYCYARAVPAANCAIDFSGAGLEIGYVGKTGDMGRQDCEHEARGDFAGYGFDIVLILRAEDTALRADIKSDLAETFSPVLNDLLRSLECGEVS
jgi:hypothetical protein